MNITVEDLLGRARPDGFHSLLALCCEYPVGALAGAIEAAGVHGDDRFGRRRQFAPQAPEAQAALDALAETRRCEVALQRLEDTREEFATTRPAAHARALYAARCKLTAAQDRLAAYGWPHDQVPALGAPSPQPARRPGDQTKIENTMARVVAVLAAAHGIDVTRPGAVQKLAEFFESHGQRPPARGTLQNVVARAIEAVDKFEIILPHE